MLTFADGNVVANKAELTPDIPYPLPSEDTAFASSSAVTFTLTSNTVSNTTSSYRLASTASFNYGSA